MRRFRVGDVLFRSDWESLKVVDGELGVRGWLVTEERDQSLGVCFRMFRRGSGYYTDNFDGCTKVGVL